MAEEDGERQTRFVGTADPEAQRRTWAGLLAVGAIHALLVFGLLAHPAELVTAPIRSLDYAAHFYGALHMAHRLRTAGAFWGYDPWWAVGYPDGQVGLIDNKLFAALLIAAPTGYEALVFNLGIVGILLLVPWLVALAARLAGGTPGECAGAALAAVVGVFAVPISVFFWSWGGISFFFACVVAVPVSVALVITMNEGSLLSLRGAGAALGAMLVAFIHPVATLVLALGCLPILWSAPRVRLLRDLVVLGGLLLLTVLPIVESTLWLRGPLRPEAPWVHEVFRGGLGQIKLDWWDHLLDTQALPNGAGGLVVILALAVLGTRGSQSRRRRATGGDLAIVSGAIGCAAATYVLPSLVPRFATLQPLRFLIPVCFFACIPAGRAVVRGLDLLIERRRAAWIGLLVGLLVIGNAVRGLALILTLGHGTDPAERDLVSFLERETREDDRILVESGGFALGAQGPFWRVIDVLRFALLPLQVRREFLGYAGTTPFTAHRYARFPGELLGKDLGRLDDATLHSRLGRYAISWVVACNADTLAKLRRLSSVLEDAAAAADCRIFRVREPERSRFLEGSGRVEADVDRIKVSQASGERLVLKYHWVPNLKTEPPLPIAEAPQPGAPVGFIAVSPGGVERFTIVPRGPLEISRVLLGHGSAMR